MSNLDRSEQQSESTHDYVNCPGMVQESSKLRLCEGRVRVQGVSYHGMLDEAVTRYHKVEKLEGLCW